MVKNLGEIFINDDDYLLLCGSCKYRKKGRCRNFNSDCYGAIVVDECSCEYWKPKKGLNLNG